MIIQKTEPMILPNIKTIGENNFLENMHWLEFWGFLSA
jgi:hypothetical protein